MRTTIQQLEDLKEWGQDPTRYAQRLEFRSTIPYMEVLPEEFDDLSDREDEYYRTGPWKTSREDYQKGQLVEPGPGRPGYNGRKVPWNKGMSDPSKFHYTSSGKKVYKSTSARTRIMDSTTVPFYSEGKQMWGIRQSAQEGKKQPVVWKKKKSDINKFIKKQAGEAQSRIDTARATGQAKRIANENKYRNSLENWTDNWFKQNKFDDVRDIDKSINKLKKDFAKAKIVKPEGVVRAAAVDGFPNIPDAGRQLKKGEAAFQKSYYRKRFLNNVLDNNPLLEKRVNQYFKYIAQDKGTLKAIQEGGYESLQAMKVAHDDMFKNIDDIMFLLSQEDTGLYGAGKYDFLNNRFKNYSAYSQKVNQSGITYLNNIKKIEDTLGPRKLKQLLNGETSIIKFMIKQQKDLAEVFDVKALPSELRFSLDHNIGVADISRMNKSQMEKYINSYIGTTVKRNTELGLRGFAATKPKLIKNINAGINVKENLAKLNKITAKAYPETLGKNPYKMVGGKVDVTKSFTFPKTQEKLFTDYFREIAKTRKGLSALKAQSKIKPQLLTILKNSGIPCFAAEGGKCDTPEDYRKGFNQLTERAAAGDKVAGSKLKKFTNTMRKLKSAGKWTGYGLLAEIGFMVPFGAVDYAAGESWKRIIGNAADWGFGPMLGQSEQEEFLAALPEGSKGFEAQEVDRLGDQLTRLEEGHHLTKPGRIGMDPQRYQEAQKNMYGKVVDEFDLNLQPFLSDTPWAKNQWHQGMWGQAQQDIADAKARVAQEKLQRIADRQESGFLAQPNWLQPYAGGGIANVRRPDAIPPESGPMPQGGGLSSVFNRVKPW